MRDLRELRGIGPQTERALNAGGILTIEELARWLVREAPDNHDRWPELLLEKIRRGGGWLSPQWAEQIVEQIVAALPAGRKERQRLETFLYESEGWVYEAMVFDPDTMGLPWADA